MKSITMNMGWVVWLLIGIGVLFIVLGPTIGLFTKGFESPEEERIFRHVFTGVFGGIGIVLVVVALFVGRHLQRMKRLQERLVSEGNFIWGEIVDISTENGYHAGYYSCHAPCILRCVVSHNDQSYICKSRHLRFNPKALLPDGKVKVWFDAYDIKKYYVDVEGSMQKPVVEI